MELQFINAYTEVLTENFDAVIKQNMLFQAKLKLAETAMKEKEELQKKYEELSKERDSLSNKISDLQTEMQTVDFYKNQANIGNDILKEKERIQQAYNESQKTISDLRNKIEKQSELILSLEQKDNQKKLVSPKKTVKEKELPKESAKIDNNGKEVKIEVKSGGTF